MRKTFNIIFFTLPLALMFSTQVMAEVQAWRLWFLQEGEVIEAAGHFLVKKTKAVKSSRLDIETRKITMIVRSEMLLHQAYRNNQSNKRLCGRASGNLKGFKLEKKEFADGMLTLSFSVPVEGVHVDMSSVKPCE